MADAKRTLLPPPLPPNYVSFLDLRDRWMKQQQEKYRLEENEREDVQPPIIEVQDDVEAVVDEGKGFVDDDRLESEAPPHPAEESVVRSSPNPKNETRKPFPGRRRQTEKGTLHRWVQVSQTKSMLPVLPLNKPNRAPKISASHSELAPLSEASKEVDDAVQIPVEVHGKTMKAQWGRKKKRINQKEDLVQSQPEKGVLAPNGDLVEKANLKVQLELKARPLEAPKVDRSVKPRDEMVNDPRLDRAKTEKTKKKKKNRKRNPKVEDVIQSQPKKEILSRIGDLDEKENSKQEVQAVRENKDAADNSKAEIEGKFRGLSLISAPVESSSQRSVAARNRHGWRKDGSFAKFEHRVMLKQERAKTEGALVWVKKGEASQIGAVPVAKPGNMRV